MSKQTVYNILASKPVKVQLGIKDDFNAAYEAAVDKDYIAEGQVIDAIETAVAGIQNLEAAQISYIRANGIGKKVEAAAAELGVDMDAQFKNKLATTEFRLKDIEKLIQYLKKAKSEINAFLK
jgi:DUF1680 family protein